MILLEYEAKRVFSEYGRPIPKGAVIRAAEEVAAHLPDLGDGVVLKAQVDVGWRGKPGGVLMADRTTAA